METEDRGFKAFNIKSVDEMWRAECEYPLYYKSQSHMCSKVFEADLIEGIKFRLDLLPDLLWREENHFQETFMQYVADSLNAPPFTNQTLQNIVKKHKNILLQCDQSSAGHELSIECQDHPSLSAAALLHSMYEKLGGFKHMLVHAVHHKLKFLYPDIELQVDELLRAGQSSIEKERTFLFRVLKSKSNQPFVAALGLHDSLNSKPDGIKHKIAYMIYKLLPRDIANLSDCQEWLEQRLSDAGEQNVDSSTILKTIPIPVQRMAISFDLTERLFSTLEDILSPDFLYWAATGEDFFKTYATGLTDKPHALIKFIIVDHKKMECLDPLCCCYWTRVVVPFEEITYFSS
eukprot:Protomagalhaensia_wolfi_Nauph_80__6189@NODE_917_length_1886_cov_32_226854_g690_i0_p1_GENE_NODE_917_length_1886_cov_32_226854_g690_i0NODE_917_length_1886_cov_32_226854_g690_i0_p1_ORF_typecomplete_len347_score30_29_NODE_917_length_1886_cov_32_226854_g690_i08451885